MSITAEHLTHIYSKGQPHEHTALDDISFTLKDGTFAGVIGHTGSGKSTLVQHLNGLLKPTSGRILIGDTDITAAGTSLLKIRRKTGLVFQYPEYQLFEETVYKDVAFGLKMMNVPQEEHDVRIREAIRSVGLDEDILNASPFDLSGGQKRRAAMAGVLVMRPEVLVLDEPASGLDPVGRAEMFRIINDLKKAGTTIVLVTHNMDEAALYADRICCVRDGSVLAVATPEELFADQSRCKELGIDIPVAASFANNVRRRIISETGTINLDEIRYDPEEEAALLYQAVSRHIGGVS